MQNKTLLILILALIGSYPAKLNEDIQVVKQNQAIRLLSNNDVELLVKKYYNETKQTLVTFIPTVHFGDKAFYDKIAELIHNKVVIYELYGMPWETKKLYKEALNKLDSSYREKNRLVQLLTNNNLLIAETFGLSAEADEKNLDAARWLLHADTNEQQQAIMELISDEGAFRKNIDGLAGKIIELDKEKALGNLSQNWIEVKRNSPSKNLNDFLQGQGTTLNNTLEEILKIKMNDLQRTGLNKVINDLLTASPSPMAWQDLARFRRNKAVNPLLEQQIWTLTQWPNGYDVALLYGVLHFQDIDAMLKKFGFNPVPEQYDGEKWIKLLSLPTLPVNS